MKTIKMWLSRPLLLWLFHTFFYTAVLLGLIIIYGFSAAHTGTFIYSDF